MIYKEAATVRIPMVIAARLLVVAGTVSITGASTGCVAGDDELPSYWPAPDFALVDQRGDTLRTPDLHGRIWVASFIFTNCTGVCPQIAARMAALRDQLREDGVLGESVRLISITVDPARDTPEVLRDYAARFGGSPPAEWAFLTGQPADEIRAMIQEGFHLSALAPDAEPATETTDGAGYQVQHSPRILLIDAQGLVRRTYDSTEVDIVDRITADLRMLTD